MAPRRLYGKGSCTLCQQRKTRCELPTESLNLPPNPNPLPTESACHRCRTLSLPCVIQAPGLATPRPPRRSSQNDILQSGQTTPSEPTQPAGSSLSAQVVQLGLASAYETCASTPATQSPSYLSNSPVAPLLGDRAYSGQYHGRPLELASALFRGSFSTAEGVQASLNPVLGLGEVLGKYANVELKAETRFAQLCTFAPFLPDLHAIIILHSKAPCPSLTLLISTILFLCCSGDAQLSRDLCSIVHASKNTVIIQSSEDLYAVQAFILLSIFAPFGILPGQSAAPSDFVVARGYIKAARSAAASISLESIVSPASLFSINAWSSADIWTWLSLCVLDASMALEGETIILPPLLAEAQQVAELLLSLASQAMIGDIRALGKILLCERVMRLAIVHAGMGSFPQILDTSILHGAKISIAQLSSALQASIDELDRLAEISDALTGCCSMVTPSQPCLLMRDTERLADIGLLRRTAIRHLLALSMLPMPQPDNASSTSMQPSITATAMSRAVDPASVADLFQQRSSSPSVQLLQTWIRQRGMALEEILLGILGCEQASTPLLLPLHKLSAIAIEACSVIVELQAALYTVSRSAKTFRQQSRIRPRSGILRQVADLMGRVEVRWPVGEGMYVGMMASSLISNMVDGSEAAAKRYESQEAFVPAEGGLSAHIQSIAPMAQPTEMEIWLYELTNGLLTEELA